MPSPARFRAARFVVAAVLLLLITVAGRLLYLRLTETYPIVGFERSRYVQQYVTLESYAARERLGSFLPPDHAQLAIHENLLQNVLARSLPWRQAFENGRYEARLERARLDFEDGLASITLRGRGRMLGPNASPLEADLTLVGHIDVVDFIPEAGMLEASLAITGVRVIRTGSALVNPVARYFGSLKAEDWNRLRPALEVPLWVERDVMLPELEGDLSVRTGRLPLAVRVSFVTLFQGWLVLSVVPIRDVETGEGEIQSWEWVAPSPEMRKRLEEDARGHFRRGRGRSARDHLEARALALADRDPIWQAIAGSDRDVVGIVPRPILQRLCARVARSYLRDARVDFDPDLRERLEERLRMKLLGGTVGAGRILGDLRVTRLRGRLRVAGEPRVRLLPPDAIELTVPVRVLEGKGRVQVDMKWDPAFLVAIICRGFQFQERLSGEVVPFSHDLRATIRFIAEDSLIVGRPSVRRDRVHVAWEFTPASLAKVRAALLEQDRLLRCGIVLNPDSVLTKVRRLLMENVRIRLPRTLFKPFRLPVSLRREYQAGEFSISARARDPEVSIQPEYLRFAFGAELTVRPREATVAVASPAVVIGSARSRDSRLMEIDAQGSRHTGDRMHRGDDGPRVSAPRVVRRSGGG